MMAQYSQGMDNLCANGYAVNMPECELGRNDGRVYYLPHHPVVNPNKDKIRIVFDYAAKCDDVSLNHQVLSGPNLIHSLVAVPSMFSLHMVALMADVEAMFHQVSGHRDVLCFLWLPDDDLTGTRTVHRMTVYLFWGSTVA